jgi:hypothetical protein
MLDLIMWLRASSPTRRQEKGGGKHSSRSNTSMHEKQAQERFWNTANGGEAQGKGDGGGSSEKPPNPKRAKHQMERSAFPGRNPGSCYGKEDLNRENYNGRAEFIAKHDMRTMEKERKDAAMKETVMQNYSPKKASVLRQESDEGAIKRRGAGEMQDGPFKSPPNLSNIHQTYIGPCIADVEKTMQTASGSSKT